MVEGMAKVVEARGTVAVVVVEGMAKVVEARGTVAVAEGMAKVVEARGTVAVAGNWLPAAAMEATPTSGHSQYNLCQGRSRPEPPNRTKSVAHRRQARHLHTVHWMSGTFSCAFPIYRVGLTCNTSLDRYNPEATAMAEVQAEADMTGAEMQADSRKVSHHWC